MVVRRLVDKTGRRLEKEIGTVYKPHVGRLRFALAFPNTYHVGMSNLGIHAVYRLLNDMDEAVCERVFLPDPADMQEVARTGAPLFTMESQTPVKDFDVLAFSIPYELDYPNVLRIISMSGLGISADEREASRHAPLVIAGGPAATFNPEPLAPFVDAFVIGEAEGVLPKLVDVLLESRCVERRDLLLRLAAVDGVYVPRFYDPEYAEDGTIQRMRAMCGVPGKVRRRWTPNLDAHSAVSAILTPDTEFSNMVLAEVARGCGRQCRFCVAGYAFLPPRSASPEAVLGRIQALGDKASRTKIGLLSASVFDHPGSLLMCRSLAEQGRPFSISSTRADTLSEDIVAALQCGGHETLTIAPEAGSERLRQVINKAMSDEEILRAPEIAWDGGFRRLKMYFMVGLPTETPEDVEGIPALVARIADAHPWERLTLSISCFVPKPWTPFQWASMEEEKLLGKKLALIKRALRSTKRTEVPGESPRESVVQGVLARGDRRIAGALVAVCREGVNWRTAFRSSGVGPYFYAHRFRPEDEVLPWDHIDLGIGKDYLWREYERSKKAAPTPACIVGACRRCGVCGD